LFISFFSLSPISPISPSIRSLDIVAILSSLITDEVLSPVILNSGWVSLTVISVGPDFCGILEEMNATTTSCRVSSNIRAGLSFVVCRSVNGKGMRTIFPFTYIEP